uniref:Uncharacterized protein n=1 Tax=Phaeomonas parva TaxID=124430 RepID=A0A6U4I0R4_9STRA
MSQTITFVLDDLPEPGERGAPGKPRLVVQASGKEALLRFLEVEARALGEALAQDASSEGPTLDQNAALANVLRSVQVITNAEEVEKHYEGRMRT